MAFAHRLIRCCSCPNLMRRVMTMTRMLMLFAMHLLLGLMFLTSLAVICLGLISPVVLCLVNSWY